MIVLFYNNSSYISTFLSVEIRNELLRVCYNFNYSIGLQCMKLISTLLCSELQSIIEVMDLAHA